MVNGFAGLIMQFAGIGGMEWIFVIVAIAIIFLGAKKIPELARSFGKATAEYEKAKIAAKRELQQFRDQSNNEAVGRERLVKVGK